MTNQPCPVSPQRPDGWYWVKSWGSRARAWQIAEKRGEWFYPEGQATSNPYEVGPRIPSPDEQQTAERDKPARCEDCKRDSCVCAQEAEIERGYQAALRFQGKDGSDHQWPEPERDKRGEAGDTARGMCTLPNGHDEPCNGYQRGDCNQPMQEAG